MKTSRRLRMNEDTMNHILTLKLTSPPIRKFGPMYEMTKGKAQEEETIVPPVQYMNFSFGSFPDEDSDCISEVEMVNPTYIFNLHLSYLLLFVGCIKD